MPKRNIFKEHILSGTPLITAELAPPKGVSLDEFSQKAALLINHIDAFNVTDNQRAVMRMAPLVPCKILLDMGSSPIFQVTCRDRNRIAIQSELLAAAAIGIENVLALTGDPIKAGDHKEGKEVFDLDGLQLIHIIKGLNKGLTSSGSVIEGKTNFFCGTTVNPSAQPAELIAARLKAKIDAGADFIQTQALFDPQCLSDFINTTKGFCLPPMLAGIFILKSAKTARFLNSQVSGIHIPDKIISILDSSNDPAAEGIAIAADLSKTFLNICNGIHLMATGDISSIVKLIKIIKKLD